LTQQSSEYLWNTQKNFNLKKTPPFTAPEYKENPLIIEPILFPEEQKVYEEEKRKEEEEKSGGKKGEKKGGKVEEKKGTGRIEEKNIGKKKEGVSGVKHNLEKNFNFKRT